MNAIDAGEVLLVGMGTLLVAVGLAASALKALFTCFPEQDGQTMTSQARTCVSPATLVESN